MYQLPQKFIAMAMTEEPVVSPGRCPEDPATSK
jgi:hypothetical protein